MDGTVSVVSKLGIGSEFTFTMNVHKVFSENEIAEINIGNKKTIKSQKEILVPGTSTYDASEDDFYEQDLEELSARMNK